MHSRLNWLYFAAWFLYLKTVKLSLAWQRCDEQLSFSMGGPLKGSVFVSPVC